MSVYVDSAQNPFGRMKMCHMMADTLDELHAMAEQLGLHRGLYQPTSSPHYDLSQSKRREAVRLGAIEIDARHEVELIRKWRASQHAQG